MVEDKDIARFGSGTVHSVYSTFALARDAEWASRLFVLEMKEPHEEGIGTFVHVDHVSPAKVSSTVVITATLSEVSGAAITCTFEARVGKRLIARGETGQMILPKDKFDSLFQTAFNSD